MGCTSSILHVSRVSEIFSIPSQSTSPQDGIDLFIHLRSLPPQRCTRKKRELWITNLSGINEVNSTRLHRSPKVWYLTQDLMWNYEYMPKGQNKRMIISQRNKKTQIALQVLYRRALTAYICSFSLSRLSESGSKVGLTNGDSEATVLYHLCQSERSITLEMGA